MDWFLFWAFVCQAFFIYAAIFHYRRRQFLQCIALILLCKLLIDQLNVIENIIWVLRDRPL